jgi:hypothetical protein
MPCALFLTEYDRKYDHIVFALRNKCDPKYNIILQQGMGQGVQGMNVIVFTITLCKASIRHRIQGLNVLVNREYARK